MSKKNILGLTYWSFQDALIQTYTLPYLKIIGEMLPSGSNIYLVTLEKNPPKDELFEAVKRELQKHKITWQPERYYPFGLKAMIKWVALISISCVRIKRYKITSIHCWCTPAGSVGYVLSKLTGASLIIDSYEPHAEAMVENGTWRRNSIAFKLLFILEKWQSKKAHTVIAASAKMEEYAKEKYNCTFINFHVKPACVDLNLFSEKNLKREELLTALNLHNKIVGVYAGKFGGIYLDKEVFEFIKCASNYWGDQFRILLLSSHSRGEIDTFCVNANINPEIVTLRFVPHSEVADYMGLGDFALTPVKPVPTKRCCTPIKDGEYWALGLPVVIPENISDDSDIIQENAIGYVLRNFNNEEFLKAISFLEHFLKKNRMEYFHSIRAVAQKYRSFTIARNIYSIIYN